VTAGQKPACIAGRGTGKWALFLAVALVAALGRAGTASAEFRDYLLGPAQITVDVQSDGSLLVRESIEFSFLGTFTGAYRDIPLRRGESIDRISVSDTGPALPTTIYRPGASAKLGSSGAPGTFGVARLKDRVRIVWHRSRVGSGTRPGAAARSSAGPRSRSSSPASCSSSSRVAGSTRPRHCGAT
jgi:hypothetical protein